MGRHYRLTRDRNGDPVVDQGLIHDYPITFNPDDELFYVHAPDTTDGTNVLGRFKDWRNAVQFARRKGA